MADKKPFAAKFMAGPGKKFSLARHDPRDDSAFEDKDKAKEQLARDASAIDALQDRLVCRRQARAAGRAAGH